MSEVIQVAHQMDYTKTALDNLRDIIVKAEPRLEPLIQTTRDMNRKLIIEASTSLDKLNKQEFGGSMERIDSNTTDRYIRVIGLPSFGISGRFVIKINAPTNVAAPILNNKAILGDYDNPIKAILTFDNTEPDNVYLSQRLSLNSNIRDSKESYERNFNYDDEGNRLKDWVSWEEWIRFTTQLAGLIGLPHLLVKRYLRIATNHSWLYEQANRYIRSGGYAGFTYSIYIPYNNIRRLNWDEIAAMRTLVSLSDVEGYFYVRGKNGSGPS